MIARLVAGGVFGGAPFGAYGFLLQEYVGRPYLGVPRDHPQGTPVAMFVANGYPLAVAFGVALGVAGGWASARPRTPARAAAGR